MSSNLNRIDILRFICLIFLLIVLNLSLKIINAVCCIFIYISEISTEVRCIDCSPHNDDLFLVRFFYLISDCINIGSVNRNLSTAYIWFIIYINKSSKLIINLKLLWNLCTFLEIIIYWKSDKLYKMILK